MKYSALYLFRSVVVGMACVASLYADRGESVYRTICSKCHQLHIAEEKLAENFFEANNTLLKLKAPTISQISRSMKEKIGDPRSDEEIQRLEVSSFIADYIIYPDKSKSVLNPKIGKCFKTMPSLKGKLTTEDIEAISNFVYDYDKKIHKKAKEEDGFFGTILKRAKGEHKTILIKATAPHCRYCKKMEKRVFSDAEVIDLLKKSFIVLHVDVSKQPLPLGLSVSMTPTFFFVFADQQSESVKTKRIPGSWSKEDFLEILKEAEKIKRKKQ
ncbi:thioredoxin family protein [Sulfurovum lithotrophicum]|nr:thioredoxin fold domain-containing protein [Sulfurovum lithotrophicum]